MALRGATEKTPAVCLSIARWSRTSHVVRWLTPGGRVDTAVKGAVRPKSMFLGQYDLNYTCETVYYANEHGGLHALRECAPLKMREELRGDWRKLAVAAHFREVAAQLAPPGREARGWFALLDAALDSLAAGGPLLQAIVRFETQALRLAGLAPETEAESGFFTLRGERSIPVPREVAQCLADPSAEKKTKILLDTARVIGVFYDFHLDGAPKTRRTAVEAATTNAKG